MTGVTPNGIRYPDGASKAKNLGPELQQMAEDIDAFIDGEIEANNPTFVAKAEAAVAAAVPPAVAAEIAAHHLVGVVKCVHAESGVWVWDGPAAPAATHYLLPDHTGALVARPTPFPTPSASAPELDW